MQRLVSSIFFIESLMVDALNLLMVVYHSHFHLSIIITSKHFVLWMAKSNTYWSKLLLWRMGHLAITWIEFIMSALNFSSRHKISVKFFSSKKAKQQFLAFKKIEIWTNSIVFTKLLQQIFTQMFLKWAYSLLQLLRTPLLKCPIQQRRF